MGLILFSENNTKYSMWPVFVVPYNLPPWACMGESNFMMALLIPGPASLGKDFDIFLEPLIEDLLRLWICVRTYDALSGKNFNLRAAVLWCVHDYPTLSTLLGRTTKGYFACTHCESTLFHTALEAKFGILDIFVSFQWDIVCGEIMNLLVFMKAMIHQVNSL
jgi:hypothetical protein